MKWQCARRRSERGRTKQRSNGCLELIEEKVRSNLAIRSPPALDVADVLFGARARLDAHASAVRAKARERMLGIVRCHPSFELRCLGSGQLPWLVFDRCKVDFGSLWKVIISRSAL
jgi:hypothetical protein